MIPVEGGDLIVAHDEGTYVFPADNEWAHSEIAIGIALDLSAAGSSKGWDDETEDGFAKRADGIVLLPGCAPADALSTRIVEETA